MSSLVLMALYAVVAFALQAVTIGLIFIFESVLGGWSGVLFVTLYFLMFWVAWPIALRLTEPKEQTVSGAQKA